MRYVETNRSTEPHSESILYLYVQDANGSPVPNVKVKIWAGPPPTGQPPYFEDDDPDNPNRRTSADGVFQFVVANPAPDKPLDFFAQILGSDDVPASDPIPFPFPANVAQWVTVTAAPEKNTTPGGEIPTVPKVQLDSRPTTEVNVTTEVVQPEAETQATEGAIIPESAASVLSGHIRNAPSGTQLSLSGEGKAWTVTVGPDGRYGFANLPAGTYALSLGSLGIVNGAIALDGKQPTVFDYSMPVIPRPPSKPFPHYLLLGPGDQPGTMTNLILALDYIVRFAPLVGFSADEAKNAQHVTIVGDENAVSRAVEQGLRDTGCSVTRLTAADSYGLENLFKQLVASGSAYPR